MYYRVDQQNDVSPYILSIHNLSRPWFSRMHCLADASATPHFYDRGSSHHVAEVSRQIITFQHMEGNCCSLQDLLQSDQNFTFKFWLTFRITLRVQKCAQSNCKSVLMLGRELLWLFSLKKHIICHQL